MEVKLEPPQSLSPSNSLRRTSNASNSPEFEFWVVSNPSFPPPNLLSADELFSDGVLLPLHHLLPNVSDSPLKSETGNHSEPEPDPGPTTGPSIAAEHASSVSDSASVLTVSKRWKGIFKKKVIENNRSSSGEEIGEDHGKAKEKEKKRGGGGNSSSSAELNINIWPFSRSKSAGNGSSRPKSAAAVNRKASSAPCSRSNSAGESKSRKWPSSPARGGVHVGRTSPVWQVKRVGSVRRSPELKPAEKTTRKDAPRSRRDKAPVSGDCGGGNGGGKGRVLNLNVPMCIGYRTQLSCRRDEGGAAGGDVANATGDGGEMGGDARNVGAGGGGGGGGGNMFNLRSLFIRKVY